MRLLLTSSGVQNKTLVAALAKLVGKPFSKTKLAFIPTAADVEPHDKTWLIEDLYNCQQLGLEFIDIVNIAALPVKVIVPRLEAVDVLVVGGGNTFHLMRYLKKTGLSQKIPNWLKTKVYVGISAGSMVMGQDILMSDAKKLYHEKLSASYKNEKGLGVVPFQIRPHYKVDYFPEVNDQELRKMAKRYKEPIYALDDEMAVRVVDGKVEVVGEGEYLLLNG